jgi:hypothetical protein
MPQTAQTGGRLNRWPKGYASKNHETVGSDILSILKVCATPKLILGNALTERLEQVKATQWYPIDLLLEPMEVLAERIGYAGLLQMGRALFKLSHEERARQTLKSAGDLLFGLDGMYRHANRGEKIGGWRVVKFQPGHAELEKTTPHHCWMEEGLLGEAFRTLGVAAFVSQSKCFRQNADACTLVVTSVVKDKSWMGTHPPVG